MKVNLLGGYNWSSSYVIWDTSAFSGKNGSFVLHMSIFLCFFKNSLGIIWLEGKHHFVPVVSGFFHIFKKTNGNKFCAFAAGYQ